MKYKLKAKFIIFSLKSLARYTEKSVSYLSSILHCIVGSIYSGHIIRLSDHVNEFALQAKKELEELSSLKIH